ncbi:MAG: hypothetical protein P1U56_01615 [Saprospiraceae bacterium]|nr:hypothetical protein [Saprospiraceae bacterium]
MNTKLSYSIVVALLMLVSLDCSSQTKLDVNASYGVRLLNSKVDFDTGGYIDAKNVNINITNIGANYHLNKLIQINLDLSFGTYYMSHCSSLDIFDSSGVRNALDFCSTTDYKPFVSTQVGLGIKFPTFKHIHIIPSFNLGYSFYSKELQGQAGATIWEDSDGITVYAERNKLIETLKDLYYANFGLDLKVDIFSFLKLIIKSSYNFGLNTIVIHDLKYDNDTNAIEDFTIESVELSDEGLLESANVSSRFSGLQFTIGIEIPLQF